MSDRRRAGSDRRTRRQANRAALDGSGPVPEEHEPVVNPGARGVFGLFGEVLMVGLLVTVVSLLVVTMPAALAAGVAHLKRFVAAEDSRLLLFWADVRAATPGGVLVGAGALSLAGLLLLDIGMACTGALPGGAVVEVVGWIGLAALGTALLAAAGRWTSDRGWPAALRGLPAFAAADLPGVLYLTATAGFVVVVTWVLVPLLIPALGCAALAVVAIPGRRRRGAAG